MESIKYFENNIFKRSGLSQWYSNWDVSNFGKKKRFYIKAGRLITWKGKILNI